MCQNSEKGKILFIPLCSQGHVNYCITITKRFVELYGDKNEVHFAVNKQYKEKLEKIFEGIPEVKLHVCEDENDQFTGDGLIKMIQFFGQSWSADAVKYCHESGKIMEMGFKALVDMYPIHTALIEKIKPNFLIFDQLFTVPTGIDQGIPYANLFSAAMNYIGLEKMPPPQSGLPTKYTEENSKLWEDFINRAYRNGPWAELKKKVSDFLKSKNVPDLDDHYFIYKPSPYLNIYGYPKELDYTEDPNIKLPGTWLRIDTPVMKPFPNPFPVPEKLKNKAVGKLIYFSLGSMAGVYKPLMSKMLNILSQLPHRFIVSKGLIGEVYDEIFEKADNLYGENYLDQFAVLQTVDMVISHGGNNTLCETFNFGKPLIFVPLFGDQADNAQRVHETGLGRRVCIFDEVDKLKKDLEDAIEYCSQESVVLKMKKISERIQHDSGLDRVCEELVKYCKK